MSATTEARGAPRGPSLAQAQAPSRDLAAMRGGYVQPAPVQPMRRSGPPAGLAHAPIAPEAGMPNISVGFGSMASFEFTQRVARALASSTLVPESYRLMVPKAKFGPGRYELIENPSAIANCIIAINMAERMRADPLMVMQNLHIIEGRPSWSSQFVIAAINQCGRFTALKFRLKRGGQRTIRYQATEWDEQANNGRGSKVQRDREATFEDLSCVAFVTEKATGETLESPEITMEMAVREGWYGRNGSKWQTIPELMIRYRAAAFLGRLNAPELLMGIRTDDETREIIEAEMAADGTWGVSHRDGGLIEPDLDDVQGQAEHVKEPGDQRQTEPNPDPNQQAERQPAADESAGQASAQPDGQSAVWENASENEGKASDPTAYAAAGERVMATLANTKVWLVREIKFPDGTCYAWKDHQGHGWVSNTREKAETAMKAMRDADDFPGLAAK